MQLKPSVLIQVEGITLAVMEKALEQAKAGRRHILQEMQACNPPPAKQLSQYAPRIRRFTIDPEKIGLVIGSGGRTVKMLQAAAGCEEIQVSCCMLHPPSTLHCLWVLQQVLRMTRDVITDEASHVCNNFETEVAEAEGHRQARPPSKEASQPTSASTC